ncbi:uncharacterized protein LOC143887200 [Tasmannia lanceolata]|uniref:uncharacterized protein LOC143887200 n=1 Tax=Tasmannia lanceolata TaxID=3420 RepID=UPI0040633B76
MGLILGIGRAMRRKRTSSLDILSSKRALRNYYKGKNCKPTGFHTRKEMAPQGSGAAISASALEQALKERTERVAREKQKKVAKWLADKAAKAAAPTVEPQEATVTTKSHDTAMKGKRQMGTVEKSLSKKHKLARASSPKEKNPVKVPTHILVEGCEGTRALHRKVVLPREQALQQGPYYDPGWKVGTEDTMLHI